MVKKWINEKHLETALAYKNLVTKLGITLMNLKKGDRKFKIVKIFSFVENLL